MSKTIDWEELGKMLDAINNSEAYIHEGTGMMCKDCVYYNIYQCVCNRRRILIRWDAESCDLAERKGR